MEKPYLPTPIYFIVSPSSRNKPMFGICWIVSIRWQSLWFESDISLLQLFIHKECTYHFASPSTIGTDKKQFIWAHFQACLFKHQSAQKKLGLGFFSGPMLLWVLLPLLLQLLPFCFQSKHPQLCSTHCPCSALPTMVIPPFQKKSPP